MKQLYIIINISALQGIAFDEIIVESNLNIRKKPNNAPRRIARSLRIFN